MKKILAPLLLILFLFGQTAYPLYDASFNQNVQNIIDTDRDKYHIPGAQVSIICIDENISQDFVSGYKTLDDASELNKIQINTPFQIASETKSFIAALILKLEADGFIHSIDDPISQYLMICSQPEQIDCLTQQEITQWGDITLRQLLNHTSGIPDYWNGNSAFLDIQENGQWKNHWTSQALLSLVVNKAPYFKPGQGSHYSNTNYILAGMVIQAATGNSIAVNMKKYLFDPLGISQNTDFIPDKFDDQMLSRNAHGYFKIGSTILAPKDMTYADNSYLGAAGANVSTAHDIAIWIKKLLDGTFLPLKQQAELQSLVGQEGQPLPRDSKEDGYGLGLAHTFSDFGEEAWWHNGESRGYRSYMIWLKRHNIILTMIIGENTDSETNTIDLPDEGTALTQDLIAYIQQRRSVI